MKQYCSVCPDPQGRGRAEGISHIDTKLERCRAGAELCQSSKSPSCCPHAPAQAPPIPKHKGLISAASWPRYCCPLPCRHKSHFEATVHCPRLEGICTHVALIPHSRAHWHHRGHIWEVYQTDHGSASFTGWRSGSKADPCVPTPAFGPGLWWQHTRSPCMPTDVPPRCYLRAWRKELPCWQIPRNSSKRRSGDVQPAEAVLLCITAHSPGLLAVLQVLRAPSRKSGQKACAKFLAWPGWPESSGSLSKFAHFCNLNQTPGIVPAHLFVARDCSLLPARLSRSMPRHRHRCSSGIWYC